VREADFGLDRYVSLDDYPRHYRHLIQDLKRDHVVVVLASQPMLLKDVMSADERAVLQFGKVFFKTPINRFESRYASPGSLKRALDAINAVTRDVAQQEGVTFVDLASRIPRDLAHFTDEVHFTERGAREVAEIIAATLVDAKMIERFHP
jgi:adenosyl cobinamide kinase/adenosyl cobinamide phosphate guanylyltransferase